MNDLVSCMLDEMVHLDKILIKRLNHIANKSAQEAKAAAAAKVSVGLKEISAQIG